MNHVPELVPQQFLSPGRLRCPVPRRHMDLAALGECAGAQLLGPRRLAFDPHIGEVCSQDRFHLRPERPWYFGAIECRNVTEITSESGLLERPGPGILPLTRRGHYLREGRGHGETALNSKFEVPRYALQNGVGLLRDDRNFRGLGTGCFHSVWLCLSEKSSLYQLGTQQQVILIYQGDDGCNQ